MQSAYPYWSVYFYTALRILVLRDDAIHTLRIPGQQVFNYRVTAVDTEGLLARCHHLQALAASGARDSLFGPQQSLPVEKRVDH